jgi:hypothetical protein
MDPCKEKQKQNPSNGYELLRRTEGKTRRDSTRNEILRDGAEVQNLYKASHRTITMVQPCVKDRIPRRPWQETEEKGR